MIARFFTRLLLPVYGCLFLLMVLAYAGIGNCETAMLTLVSRDSGNREILLLDACTRLSLNLSQHPDDDYHPVWSPDGKHLAFVSERDGNSEIYIYTLAGGTLKN
ncbi:MAG: TolB family protein, partial [Aggregatilineales bacterium]